MRGILPLVAGSIAAGALIAAAPDEVGGPSRPSSKAEKKEPAAANVRPEGPAGPPAPAAPPPSRAGATSPAPAGAPPPTPAPKGSPTSPPAPRPAEEVRAIWLTRWDFRTEADVRRIIAGCASLGLNRVVFQVRGQADAYYRSSFEPWGEELQGPPERGGDPGFDPLGVALEEAHRRGLTLHAWANVLPGWKGTAPPRSPNHIVHLHPEWFLPDRDGRPKPLDDHYAMLNPCLAAVRAHLAKVLGEIAERYPVDGLQIDYIRYLDGDLPREGKVAFAREGPILAAAGARSRAAQEGAPDIRRKAMDLLVGEISKAVRRRPGLRLSVAAIRDGARARKRLFQDAEGWKRRGWIDDVYPMNYETDAARFEDYSREWVKACGGDSVVMGIGVHLLDGARGVLEQVRVLRGAAAGERPAGYCLFACSEFLPTASPESRRDAEGLARMAQLRALLAALNRTAERAGGKTAGAAPAKGASPAPSKSGAAPSGKSK